ncbi:hypothetical protein [Roseateles sp.]|uniref:hypothetical protein n=1 Tax=Roseateles sp. TaxID=1971397 RepID=UPI002F4215B9
MKSNLHPLSALIGAAVLLSGCQTAVVHSSDASKVTAGLVYALPKGQIALEASRTVVTAKMVADAEKAAKETADDVTAASKVNEEAALALKDAEAQLAVSGDSVKADLTKKRDLADAIARLRKAQVEAVKLAAKEAEKRLAEVKAKEGQLEQAVTLKAGAPVADRNARYVAVLNDSMTRDDTVKITTENGLLATGSTDSTGQLGAILVNLAAAFASSSLGSKPALTESLTAGECKPFKYSATFDPLNHSEVKSVAKELADKSQGTLTLKTEASSSKAPVGLSSPELASSAPPPPSDSGTPGDADASAGLFYRPLVSTTITVEESSAGPCAVNGSASFARLTTTMPDSETRFLLPLKAGQFTRTKLDFEFKNGSPTGYRSERQSQLNAIARIPVDILKAIIEVPASIIKLRVDLQSQNTGLIEAQTKQLLAEAEVMKAQKALADEKAKADSSSTP